MGYYTDVKWQMQIMTLEDDRTDVWLPSKNDPIDAADEALDHWLSKFVYEVRKENVERCPRNTIISLVSDINSYFKMVNRVFNLLNNI